MISAHEYTLTVDGVSIPVEGGQVALDETWSPYVQAQVTIPLPSSAVLARLDPRAAGRARLTLAARYGSPTPVSRVTDLWAGRALSEVTKGKILRRNPVPNPSFELGASGWNAVAGTGGAASIGTTTSDPYIGARSGRVSWSASPTAGYPGLYTDAPLIGSAGTWVAVALVMKTGPTVMSRISLTPRMNSTAVAATFSEGPYTQTTWADGAWRRLTHAVQSSAPFNNVRIYPHSPQAALSFMDLDGVVIGTGATQAEALAAVEGHFNGDTPDTAARLYEWEGTPHASPSVERDPTTAWGGLTLRAITADLSEPLNTSGHRDTSTRTLDLGVADREIDRRGATVTLSLAGDEALLQDYRAMTPLTPGTWTVRAAVTLALAQIGAVLQPGTADGTITDESAVWEVGTTAWDYAQSLVDAAGLRLWCDELRRWWLAPPLAPEASPDVYVVTLPDSHDVRERLARDEWATGVIVTYEWDTDAGRQRVHDTAGTGPRVEQITIARPFPGNGAAAAILKRMTARGSEVTATEVATYAVTPGWVMQSLSTDTAHQAGLVSSVRWDLERDTVTVTSRDLSDTPARAWIMQPAGYRWIDVPVGAKWTTYNTPTGV